MAPSSVGGKDDAVRASTRTRSLSLKARAEADGEDQAAIAAAVRKCQNLRSASKAKQGAQVVGRKTPAKPTPIAPPEGNTTLEASAQSLFGEGSDPGKAQVQEAYYKWYTFKLAQNAMREAVAKAKMLRMERYSVASVVRAAAADVLSQAPKPARTPTPKRPARKVVVESSGAEGDSTLEPLVEAWLKASNTKELKAGLVKAQIVSQEDLACYTPGSLQKAIESAGGTALPHLCIRLMKCAKAERDPSAELDGTAGSRHASADVSRMIQELSAGAAGGAAAVPAPSRPEIEGLECVGALFERIGAETSTSELVSQFVEILECKTSSDPELAAEMLEGALQQMGLDPQLLVPPKAGAKAARMQLIAIRGGQAPSTDTSGNSNPTKESGESELEGGQAMQMVDLLAQSIGKTPADGIAAMKEETGHLRLARVAVNSAARETLARLSSDDVLRSEERLAKELTAAQSVHPSLRELLHHSNLNKLPTGGVAAGGVVASAAAIRVVAAQAQKVQAMGPRALATGITDMCPPGLVASGGVPGMVTAVWFQQVGNASSSSSTSFKIQSLIKEGTQTPSLQGKKLSDASSMKMLLSGVPALAVAQMASNPADTSAQRVAARVTSLAGFRPEKVQHGTQLVIAPFLEKLESMQLRFETGCGELPTFQAAWDEVLATPVVKKYIEMYEEAHIVGDEPSSALQQRVESMEKQLKTALEEVKRTRQRQPNQPATVAAVAGAGDALSAKVAELMGRKDITDAEWSALSREEREAVKQARKAAKKAGKGAPDPVENGEEE